MKLHNLGGKPFLTLPPEERLAFIGRYREKRFADFTTLLEFNLAADAAKPKKQRVASSSSSGPKERKKSDLEQKIKVNSVQLDMLKKLGLLT